MPFKDAESTVRDAYYVEDADTVTDATECMKRILDAKYEAADLDEICRDQQPTLSDEEKEALRRLLYKYEDLFDGTLGKWTGSPIKLTLTKDATPYHARAFPVPRCHLATLKQEVERLCKLGVLKKVNRLQWAAPTFLIPKKDDRLQRNESWMTQGPRLRTQAPDRRPHVTVIARSLFRLSYLPEQFVLIPTALLASNRQQQPAPQQPRTHQDYLTPSSGLPLRQYDLGIFPVQRTTWYNKSRWSCFPTFQDHHLGQPNLTLPVQVQLQPTDPVHRRQPGTQISMTL